MDENSQNDRYGSPTQRLQATEGETASTNSESQDIKKCQLSCDKCRCRNKEPVMTIHLLNEIRKFCNTCGDLDGCAIAKSAAAMTGCDSISRNRDVLIERAGVTST
jgi:hypothetical protein